MVDIIWTVRLALRALKANKMRSALTMLGIIIGVASVIAMLAVGSGATNRITKQISSMGSNLLIVLPGSTTSGGLRMGAGTQPTLTSGDAQAIEKEAPAVDAVAPILSGAAQIVYGHQNWSTVVVGTTPSMLVVRNWTLSAGRAFTGADVRNATKVCLLGQTVVNNLFGDEDPVGQTVMIKNLPFMVIGVLGAKGQSVIGQDQDDTIFIPLTTAQRKLFGTPFPGMVRILMVKAKNTGSLDAAQDQITDILRQRHHIGPGRNDDFTVRNLTQMMQTAEKVTGIMTLVLGAIASVSLLVGGIGIMNIMLVSITERTREIGIRMAVGAKIWDIRFQFLMEAFIISMIGGTAGIILGAGGSALLAKIAGWPVSVSSFSVLLAFGFSGAVGVFFGFYPAWKASLLNPIDALRYE